MPDQLEKIRAFIPFDFGSHVNSIAPQETAEGTSFIDCASGEKKYIIAGMRRNRVVPQVKYCSTTCRMTGRRKPCCFSRRSSQMRSSSSKLSSTRGYRYE